MHERLVGGRVWDDVGMGYTMLYTSVMFGYEFAARVGEFIEAEGSNTDHCVRTDDLSFSVEAPGGYLRVEGSALANLTPAEAGEGFKNVSECSVRGVTTKGKITVKSKFVARRSPEESLFLNDLIKFIVHAKAKGTEELFSYRKTNRDQVVLTGNTVMLEYGSYKYYRRKQSMQLQD
jgi:hypothetical protein